VPAPGAMRPQAGPAFPFRFSLLVWYNPGNVSVPGVAKRSSPRVEGLSLANVASGALWVLGVGGLLVSFVLWSRQHFATPPVTYLYVPVIAGEMIVAFAYATVGSLLASIRPRNPIGWLFLGMGVVTAIQLPLLFLVADAQLASRTVPGVTLVGAWLASSAHLPFVGILGIWAILVFPTGHLVGRRWALAGAAAAIGAAAVSVAIALSPGGLLWYTTLANPFAAPDWAASSLLIVGIAGGVLLVAGLLAAGASMIVRYQRSGERGRLQLRWIAFAVALLTSTAAPFLLVRYVLAAPEGVASWLAGLLVLTAGAFPLTAAIAILRYRLLDIDLILNRTIVYVPLSAILAGLFGALAILVQKIFQAVTGGDTSDIAIVVATILVALTVTPLQRTLQELADRYVKPAEKAGGAAQAGTSPQPSGVANEPPEPAELDATLRRIVTELEALEERIEELEPKRPARRSTSHRPKSREPGPKRAD
jgi:hypothetical protein